MEIQEKATLTLLQIVENDSNVKKLKHIGLTYSEIAGLIDSNISNGNLTEKEGVVTLTAQGALFFSKHKHLLKETDKSKWILPDSKNKIAQIDKDEVYLPSRKELSFLKKLP